MKEKLIRFMQGRYGMNGPDSLNRFLLIGSIAVMVLSFVTGWDLLYIIAIVFMAYAYVRMFSKNVPKRYAENQTFIKSTAGIRGAFLKKKNELKQSKTHHIYKCPSCKQKIRVPRGKGRIAVKCPKCHTEFIKNS